MICSRPRLKTLVLNDQQNRQFMAEVLGRYGQRCVFNDAAKIFIPSESCGEWSILREASDLHAVAEPSHPFLVNFVDLLKEGDVATFGLHSNFIARVASRTVSKVLSNTVDLTVVILCLEMLQTKGTLMEIIKHNIRRMSFRSVHDSLKLLRDFVENFPGPSKLSSEDVDLLVNAIHFAFLKSLPDTDEQNFDVTEFILLQSFDARLPFSFALVEGVVAPEPDLTAEDFKSSSSCIHVLVFSFALIESERNTQKQSYHDSFLNLIPLELKNIHDKILASGVQIVICQKAVNSGLKIALKRCKVICVELFGQKRTKAVTQLSGARKVRCWNDHVHLEQHMGMIDAIEFLDVGTEPWIVFKKANSRVSSIIFSETPEFLEQTEVLVSKCLILLNLAVRYPFYVRNSVDEMVIDHISSSKSDLCRMMCEKICGSCEILPNLTAHVHRIFDLLVSSLRDERLISDKGNCDSICLAEPKLMAYKVMLDIVIDALKCGIVVTEVS